MNEKIELRFLDHVAIRVKDLEISANWYEKVLDLKKHELSKWGPYPIFMLTNRCGVALFPMNNTNENVDVLAKTIRIDHFAFNVDRANFERVKKKYADLKLEYSVQDHFYFDSIYTKDPDGYTVELTTIKVDDEDFYK